MLNKCVSLDNRYLCVFRDKKSAMIKIVSSLMCVPLLSLAVVMVFLRCRS